MALGARRDPAGNAATAGESAAAAATAVKETQVAQEGSSHASNRRSTHQHCSGPMHNVSALTQSDSKLFGFDATREIEDTNHRTIFTDR